VVRSRARGVGDGEPVFTIERTFIARSDGGFGGAPGPKTGVHAIPRREADLTSNARVRRNQALLYRLCGDRNPLHADPLVAREAGFPRPVLHGLCTFGIACRAVLRTICEYDHTLIVGFDARFSAPVYPGETLVTEMWQDANIVSFRCRVVERDAVVLNHGRCVLAT